MKVADAVRKYWDQEGAQHYHNINRINFEKLRKDIVKHLTLGKNEIVLDFGAGPGDLALMLAESGYHNIIGLDINESMLELARNRCNDFPIQFIHGDGMHLPLKDRSVGAVVSKWVLWVMPSPEKAIDEMIRVLKPGGTILVISSENIGEKKKNIFHKLRGFPLNHLHSCCMRLKYRRSLTTKQFWCKTRGKLPLLSLNQYTQIFHEKGLTHVEKTDPEDYGSIRSKILFYQFKFSIVRGVKKKLKTSTDMNTLKKGEIKKLQNLINVIVCPVCRSDLIKGQESELICSGCKKIYPIENEVPNLMPLDDMLI